LREPDKVQGEFEMENLHFGFQILVTVVFPNEPVLVNQHDSSRSRYDSLLNDFISNFQSVPTLRPFDFVGAEKFLHSV